MTEIFTAKTVEEAKEKAVRKFGRKAAEIKFEVIEEGKKGFLGIGQVDAKVKATFNAPAPKPEAKKEVRKATAPLVKTGAKPAETPKQAVPEPVAKPVVAEEKPVEPVTEEVPEPVAEEAVTAEPVVIETETETETKETAEPVSEIESKESGQEEKGIDENFSLEDFTLIEDETMLHEKVKIARDYISSILNAMEISCEFIIYQNETGAVIDIKSSNNGTIIGRRGETLDSIQYLCSIIANKGDKDYFRITIDCLGYRNKRKETLKQLAGKVAKSVIKTGRSQQLEPMNPYERRVIHSAISEIEGVSSRSVGEEPYRKIIIVSDNPRNSRRKGSGSRRDGGKGGNRRNDRQRVPREPMEVKAIDLTTSFEKDYKKPKPEDTMEGGLYGKVEL